MKTKEKKQVKKVSRPVKNQNQKKTEKGSKSEKTITTALTVVNNSQQTVKHEPIKTVEIPISLIVFNDNNPRKLTDDSEVQDLIQGISKNGLINPITVRKYKDNEKYELIAGERRLRACKILGFNKISCIIKNYDDHQSLNVMMDENLTRQPLKPLDEARQYQKIIWDEKLTIKDIALRFGQKESYIYSRLSLLNMIPKIEDLVNREILTLSAANEIAKYSLDIQETIYDEHLTENSFASWLELSTKEIKNRLKEYYSPLLCNFNFDKTECENCNFNSEFLSLFPTEKRYCKNQYCLTAKNEEYITSQAIGLAKEYPGAEINLPPQFSCDDNVIGQFMELGLPVINEYSLKIPEMPQIPEQSGFQTAEDYDQAYKIYLSEEKDYEEKKEEFETALQEGRAKIVIDLSNNEPNLKYINLKVEKEQPASEPQKTEADTPKENKEAENKTIIDRLKMQDIKNKKACEEKIIKESVSFLKQSDTLVSDITEFEHCLLYYIMLSEIRSKNLNLLLLNSYANADPKKRFEATKKLSDTQKNVIIRDFLIHYLTDTWGYGHELLKKFMETNFPEKMKTIQKVNTDAYQKLYENIEKQLKVLQPEQPEVKEEEKIPAIEIEEKPQITENIGTGNLQPDKQFLQDYEPEDEQPFNDIEPGNIPAEIGEVEQEEYEEISDAEILESDGPLFYDMLPSVAPVIINDMPYFE